MNAPWIIIWLAGEPGDRWFVLRKRDGREESPDSSCSELARAGYGRATRLVTPGGSILRQVKAGLGIAATESATENKTAGELAPLRQVLGKTKDTPLSVERIWQG